MPGGQGPRLNESAKSDVLVIDSPNNMDCTIKIKCIKTLHRNIFLFEEDESIFEFRRRKKHFGLLVR